MCCVIGYRPNLSGLEGERKLFFSKLMSEARIRGTHSFGVAQYDSRGRIEWTKTHDLDRLELVVNTFDPCHHMIAHARYSTSGDYTDDRNNQPIVVSEHDATEIALVFNGVIHMGTREEFSAEYGVKCVSDNDGEVFVRRLLAGQRPIDFLDNFNGSFAGLWLAEGALSAMRNERRPLWRAEWLDAEWFASTRDIFRRAGIPDDHREIWEVEPYTRIFL